jgi:hypothetical protein
MTGTGPFQYQWYDATNSTTLGTTQSVTVYPTATTEYYVIVSNACGYETSQWAKVTVASCTAPTTGEIKAVAQPDGSWILKPNPEARTPRTYSWTRLSDGAVLGTSETLAVGVLAATTTFRLTISDACGSATGEVTIEVPLPLTNGLQATWSSSTGQISVSWPPISGATSYTVERRALGGAWEMLTTNYASNSFTDAGVVAARTYVYRVTSNNQGRTNYDVATTMTFTAAVAGQVVTPVAFDSMLAAVNKVREAAGWPAVTWSNILAANDPLPAPGQLITARQIMSCRARMNEALQALGIAVANYSNPDLVNLPIRAVNVNEVQQRAN